MKFTSKTKKDLEKKGINWEMLGGYGNCTAGDLKGLDRETIGVIVRSKTADGDFIDKTRQMPFVTLNNASEEAKKIYGEIIDRSERYSIPNFDKYNIYSMDNAVAKDYNDENGEEVEERDTNSFLGLERWFFHLKSFGFSGAFLLKNNFVKKLR